MRKIESILAEKINSTRTELSDIRKKINWIVFLRFLTFFTGLLLGILFFKSSLALAIIFFVVFMFVFLYTVKIHERYKSKREHLLNLVEVYLDETNILNLDLDKQDAGNEFIEPTHPYIMDLDIFGDNSLFQLVNRTSTFYGKEKLADRLKRKPQNEKINLYQNAIGELSLQEDYCFNFQAIGRKLLKSGIDTENLYHWLNQENYFSKRKFLKVLSALIPGITLSLFIMSIFGLPVQFALIFAILQLFITSLFLKKINSIHSLVSRKAVVFGNYSLLFREIEKRNFDSEILNEIQNKLRRGEVTASVEINKLANLVRYLDNRLNMAGALLLNALLMWDINIMFRIEDWKTGAKDLVGKWIDGLAEFEATLSMAGFAYLNSNYVYPQIKDELGFYGNDVGHPLIPEDERIVNDFEISKKGEVLLITGSNMAGKSTYLRTIGFNMVLAMMGCPVCASGFSFYPIQLLSSMRVKDNLVEKESTFYAELKRLKAIIDYSKDKEALIMLDEILKGTNSKDKLTGSFALIRQLVRSESAALIATHDLDLSVLEDEFPEQVHNYNFEVNIHNGEFHFDYKLKRGVCQVLNATELMRTMGINV